MKTALLTLLVSLALVGPGLVSGKERKPDPRLKQVHTIFVKDEHNVASDSAKANLEKWTCFKPAPSANQADAEMTVLWSSESKNSPLMDTSIQGAAAGRPLSIGENHVFHTTLTLNTRDGNKRKKVWSKSVGLGDSEERRKSGVSRLMEELKTDACTQP